MMVGFILFSLLSIGTATVPTETIEFEVGQVWSVKKADPGLRVIIGRIDNFDGGIIVSVGIENVPVPSELQSRLKNKRKTVFSHVPMAEEALRSSVEILIGEGEEPPEQFEEGYRYWREAYDSGNGGAYSIIIPEIIALSFETVQSGEQSND